MSRRDTSDYVLVYIYISVKRRTDCVFIGTQALTVFWNSTISWVISGPYQSRKATQSVSQTATSMEWPGGLTFIFRSKRVLILRQLWQQTVRVAHIYFQLCLVEIQSSSVIVSLTECGICL